MCVKFCVVTLLAAAAQASDVPDTVPAVLHTEPAMPAGWRKSDSTVAYDQPLTLRFSLQKQNLAELEQMAVAVSDPQSNQYGQYLSADAVRKMTAPLPSHIETVKGWLNKHRVPFTRLEDDAIIKAHFTAGKAASLLRTKFHHAKNDATAQDIIRSGDYWLPADVHYAVAAVYGMHGLPLPPRDALKSASAPGLPAKVTPEVLFKTYNVSGVTASASTKNSQAVAEFQGQTMKPSDLVKFFEDYVKGSSADTVSKFVGDPGTGIAGVEASLDIDYIMGVAPGLKTEFWYWKGNDFCNDLSEWTSAILSAKGAPLVHSVSYGWQGELEQIGCKQAQVSDVDANFQKLAAMGVTIIFASGDSGSGYKTGASKLYPSWPASSPWVTAVGATRFQDQQVGHLEMATDQFGSGGGFSTMFKAFKAQEKVAKHYLSVAQDLPPQSYFPKGGRATPDVSMMGEGYQVVANGQVESVGVTSASAPAFGALVSLLNEARIKAGNPAMGYLNPFLYQNPEMFRDVTVGTNAIGRGTGPIKYGFKCAVGWDPATGLGTPNFQKMLRAAMSLTDAKQIIV